MTKRFMIPGNPHAKAAFSAAKRRIMASRTAPGPLGLRIFEGNSAPRTVSRCRVPKPGNKVTR